MLVAGTRQRFVMQSVRCPTLGEALMSGGVGNGHGHMDGMCAALPSGKRPTGKPITAGGHSNSRIHATSLVFAERQIFPLSLPSSLPSAAVLPSVGSRHICRFHCVYCLLSVVVDALGKDRF